MRSSFNKISFISILCLVFVLSLTASVSFAETFEWNVKQRPAVLVSDDHNGVYKLSNVRWGFDEPCGSSTPKWRTVTLDANKIKDVIFIVKPFPPEWIAAHCLMFFEFDAPVVTEYGEKSNGFVLSIEARLQKGQNYSLVSGNFGAFYIVYQLGCKEDYIQISSLENKTLIPYKLNLSHDQKVQLMKNVIAESIKNRDNEKYNTLNNSCTNNLFLLLNAVLPQEQQFKEWILKRVLYNLSISFPRTAGKLLKKHNLVAEALPMIKPKSENRADIATKQLAGAELEAATRKLSRLESKLDEVKNIVIDGISEGNISKDLLKTLMYNEIAEQVTGLHIPGTVIGEKNNGEFFIGRDFADELDKTTLSNEITGLVKTAFDAYKNALRTRMTLEGPDVSIYLEGQIDAMKRTFQQAVNYSKLNER